ncbi:unnamed protein product [Arctia plantaginis]|uniref:Adenosine deaminase n=1 Tax=Arctia plantaginis TaxID=874455 RepID=A0A8S0YQX4_ARCPL|nr:unnamed protein product [Arctia plantaginis]
MRYIILTVLIVYTKCDDYYTKRNQFLKLESDLSLGGNTTLTVKEGIVNKCLMIQKLIDADNAFDHPETYNFSRHFFSYKDRIPTSKVYKIIKAMPKGAVLHIHDMAIMGPDYMLNITYMDHLYVCIGKRIQFLFSKTVPKTECCGEWQLMSQVRHAAKNVTKFDLEIRKHFTLVVDNPDFVYPTIKESWDTFMQYFGTVLGLITYEPVWQQYFYDALDSLRKDNVMYVEVRSVLPKLYDLDGTVYDQKVTAKSYRKAIKKFVSAHPEFIGAKLIFAPSRQVDAQTVEEYVKLARELKNEVPDIFAGFDLVGREDLGNPLIEFASILNDAKDLKFFFHAGETDWYGSSTDMNLIDAVLLGAKRIGHAYALTKHPVVMKHVIENDIGLEINIVSNAVLSLVKDIRNHPLSVFLSHNLPVVLSSDDPGAWEADPLSDDFYIAFVGVSSKFSDLRMLKTLALNSLKYSALDPVEKQRAIRSFHQKWDDFVENFDCSKY